MMLPEQFKTAHDLCYANHDVMLHLLNGGFCNNSFCMLVDLSEEDQPPQFETNEDLFSWLDTPGHHQTRAEILRCTVFPAVLGDFLHFVYEALRCSQKTKLTVAIALLRKPLQDSLGLLETIFVDLLGFASKMVEKPADLNVKRSGGKPDEHVRRIGAVLDVLDEQRRFDAEFLAQVRYSRGAEDSFAGSFDKALHLFTSNKNIETEKLNLNFIFSGPDAWHTQRSYIYSRLPYVLCYARLLVEAVFSTIDNGTDPVYLDDIERRISAATMLWSETIVDPYRCSQLDAHVQETWSRLMRDCQSAGFRTPTRSDLLRMSASGAWPGELWIDVKRRLLRYRVSVMLSKVAQQRASSWVRRNV
ncbi:MAG: hypothetical protein PHU25_14975 [Deltaproteobacteria bacterium]|nr:hypothetical protein [Deltaproteobacteria bacterium]